MRLLSGDAYLQPVGTEPLEALARVAITSYGAGLGVSFIYLGFGSTVLGYLWLKSSYIPRGLALLGIIASFLLAAGAVRAAAESLVAAVPFYMVPLFFFEVGMGYWLLVKSLRTG